MFLLGSNFFGTLSFLDFLEVYFLCQIGEVLHYFFNKFSISCSSSSPSVTSMIQMLEYLKLSHRFLCISSFSWIFVSSFCSGLMFISSFSSKLFIWVPVSFPSLLVPCIYFFILLYIAFTSSSILWPYSTISVRILITSVLNSASDRLAISSSLSSILELWSVLTFVPYFFCLRRPIILYGVEL